MQLARLVTCQQSYLMNKQIKIVLVQPSTRQAVQSLFTFHKNEGLGHKPPLAILILATYLRDMGLANVTCLDAQLEGLSPEQTVERLAGLRPDLVGITTWTDFWYPTWKTVSLLKRRLPGCQVVLGGPHCTIYPRETLEASQADYVVAGDGEESLYKLAQDLQSEALVGDHPGLWRKHFQEIIAPSQPMATLTDINSFPAPDRELLPYRRYNNVLHPSQFETTMITSRGCPHKCVFCKMHVQQVHARSAEKVVEEFKNIADLGISDIQLYDDTFTWSKKRVMRICQGIMDHGLKLNWAVRDRVKRADPEMYAMMKKAGCYRIHFGVESGSPPVLASSGKGITLEEVQRAVSLAKAAGFTTLAYYMFGFLDETYQDALKTIEFSRSLDTDYAVFAVLIPYPATSLYLEALERGILSRDFWLDFTRNPQPDFRVPSLIEQNMDRATLIKLKDMANRRYYFRPKTILSELKSLRSWQDLILKGGMARNMITDSFRSLLFKKPAG